MPSCHLPLDQMPRFNNRGSLGWGSHGSEVVNHNRPNPFWSLHAYPYFATWTIAGTTLKIRPGCLSLTPPGMAAIYRYSGPCAHFYVHFQCPTGTTTELPLLIDAGPRAADLLAWLEKAEAVAAAQPNRALTYLWMVLWEYADVAGVHPLPVTAHDLARRASSILEKRFGGPPRIASLAADLGVSARHLQRLFHAHYGCSIRAWIAARKGERMRTLLRHSDLPLADIARQVGIRDHQHFNKTTRRLLGASPRCIRGIQRKSNGE